MSTLAGRAEPGSWLDRMVRRGGVLPRRSRPREVKTAFVLSGGGNLGALQVGMLQALFERHIQPDLIVGCSVGAVNGAGLAAQPSLEGIRHLETMWGKVEEFEVMPQSWIPSPMQLAKRGSSIHGNAGLRRLIEYGLTVPTFERLPVPFTCVATEVETAEERWFTQGSLVLPILASAALPTVFPPVVIDGKRYLDGGVVNDVPISRALELGANRLVVLHVGMFEGPQSEPRRPIDVARWAYWLARQNRFRRDLAAVPASCEVLLVGPGRGRGSSSAISATPPS